MNVLTYKFFAVIYLTSLQLFKHGWFFVFSILLLFLFNNNYIFFNVFTDEYIWVFLVSSFVVLFLLIILMYYLLKSKLFKAILFHSSGKNVRRASYYTFKFFLMLSLVILSKTAYPLLVMVCSEMMVRSKLLGIIYPQSMSRFGLDTKKFETGVIYVVSSITCLIVALNGFPFDAIYGLLFVRLSVASDIHFREVS